MPQPEGCLAGIDADAVQIELKFEFDVAEGATVHRLVAGYAEPALLYRKDALAVAAEFVGVVAGWNF